MEDLVQQTLKNNTMTVDNLVYRFLKDNGLFCAVRNQLAKHNRWKKQKVNILIPKRILCTPSFRKEGLRTLFYENYRYNTIFSGDHHSPKRRLFYKLNKKWKEFVKDKCYLQHNINIGDVVDFCDSWNTKRNGKIMKMNGTMFYVKETRHGYESWRSLMSVENIEGKPFVLNLYYKDENGNEYGKIEGSYAEIQLQ